MSLNQPFILVSTNPDDKKVPAFRIFLDNKFAYINKINLSGLNVIGLQRPETGGGRPIVTMYEVY